MRGLVLLVLLVVLAGCGGTVAPDPQPAPVDGGDAVYSRSDSERIDRTAPGEVASLAISCGQAETLVVGSCSVTAGGSLVENRSDGLGWLCAAVATEDGVTLAVAITCAR